MASDSAALKEKKVIQTHFLFKQGKSNSSGLISDWCDWIGDGWQCSCQELEKRRVGRTFVSNKLNISFVLLFFDCRYNVTSILDTDTSKYEVFL